MNSYIYTFIREDLSPEQKIVQLGHACHEAGKRTCSTGYAEPSSLILLSAKNERDLVMISRTIEREGIDHHMFYEPDVDSYTAICTRPITLDRERRLFRRWKLYRLSN